VCSKLRKCKRTLAPPPSCGDGQWLLVLNCMRMCVRERRGRDPGGRHKKSRANEGKV
jgi:hypothetical protein